VRGIILDLRDDPGGYLDQAVTVASEFIPAGSGKNVLIVRSRTGSVSQPVSAGGLATTTPVVILVNNGTASAAEITAGSIAVDRKGVHVVGQTTFGTGTVLEPFMLGDGSALWLGTEEWLLPNGQSIYHTGYTPDQQVALPANVAPLSALVAKEETLSESQILNSGDAQLVQAIQDLGGAQS
jgi:carboxyl-terminal processing protease